ncbi:hypothetical protein SOM26_03080, partial [Sphingomonas sp. CFBP8993]|nr:hypothetical protein [Sphingomonas sp. CFBP8993]
MVMAISSFRKGCGGPDPPARCGYSAQAAARGRRCTKGGATGTDQQREHQSAGARALVVSRLADPSSRDWSLRFVQPVSADLVVTPLDRLIKPVEQAVRSAPDVIAAANKVGRI